MSAQQQNELQPPNVTMLIACGVALATLVPVVLHQIGVVEHLPDPPGGLFDSDGITESKAAHPLGVPDGLLGLASYGTTFGLMLAAKENSTARKLLAAKLAMDGGIATINVVRQLVQFGKICSWCTGTALATAAMLFVGRSFLQKAAQSMQGVTHEEL